MEIVAPPAPGKLEDLRRRFFATPLQAVMSLICLAIMAFIIWKLLNWAVFSAVFTTSVSGSGAVMPVTAREKIANEDGEFSTRGARQNE